MIDLTQARALREAGAPFQAIADRFGVSRQVAHQALTRKRTGGKPGPRRKIDYAEVVALRGDGWQYKQIAIMMGCSVSTAQRAVYMEAKRDQT